MGDHGSYSDQVKSCRFPGDSILRRVCAFKPARLSDPHDSAEGRAVGSLQPGCINSRGKRASFRITPIPEEGRLRAYGDATDHSAAGVEDFQEMELPGGRSR